MALWLLPPALLCWALDWRLLMWQMKWWHSTGRTGFIDWRSFNFLSLIGRALPMEKDWNIQTEELSQSDLQLQWSKIHPAPCIDLWPPWVVDGPLSHLQRTHHRMGYSLDPILIRHVLFMVWMCLLHASTTVLAWNMLLHLFNDGLIVMFSAWGLIAVRIWSSTRTALICI